MKKFKPPIRTLPVTSVEGRARSESSGFEPIQISLLL